MPFDFQSAYDELNAADDDYRFYADVAVASGARRVIDLGCGTGTLAHLLAGHGLDVVGIDPDPDMLRVARSKEVAAGSGGTVEWRLGNSKVLDAAAADLAVMSGHVAQVFVDDDSWRQVLADLHRALLPRATLAFESRNPSRRKWEEWTRAETLRTVDTRDGVFEYWHETVDVNLPQVAYDTFARNPRTGETTTHRDVLAFRDQQELRASVSRAGFIVTDVFGDWDRGAASAGSPELIVLARKR